MKNESKIKLAISGIAALFIVGGIYIKIHNKKFEKLQKERTRLIALHDELKDLVNSEDCTEKTWAEELEKEVEKLLEVNAKNIMDWVTHNFELSTCRFPGVKDVTLMDALGLEEEI